MDEVGEFVKIHQPCPDCGSHDALSVRADGSTLCFSCGAKHNGNKRKEVVKKVSRDIVPEAGRVAVNGIPDRGITADTCAKYGVRVVVKAQGIAQHVYPYYDSAGNLVAQKIRTVEGKRFDWTGQANKAGLFGQNLFPSSGKYITITEGECFKESTQVLTPSGWISIKDWNGELVMDGEGNFNNPVAYIAKNYHGNMYEVCTKFLSMVATEGHNIIYKDNKGVMQKKPFKDTPFEFKVPLTIVADTEGCDMSDDMLRVLVMISADGSIETRKNGSRYVRIAFKKSRKIDRCEQLLESLNISYHKGEHKRGMTCFCFSLQEAFKEFPIEWLGTLTQHQRLVVLEELSQWDGHRPITREQIEYYTNNEHNAEFVQTLAHLSGFYAGVSRSKQGCYKDRITVRTCLNKQYATVQGDKKSFKYDGRVYCLQMPTGSLLLRDNGHIFVCGNCDAMAVYQMQGSQYPVVSVRNGAGGIKDIKEAYEYLNGFEHIVLCFDGDEAGTKGMSRIAEILPPKKVRIVKLPPDMKDANEFLKAGKVEEFKRLWWKQEEFRPADIVNIGDMFDRVLEYRKSHQYIPTPWQGLNDIITGTRPGQIVIIAAGSGQGKSAILKTWMSYLQHTVPDMKIGSLYLEENPEDTVVNLMSLEAGLNLKKPDVWDAQSEDNLKKYFEQCGAERSIELFEPIENTEPDYITDKIRYLAQARECKIIFFDHITYVVDDSEDVKRDINKLMKNLHDMCVALNITVIAACHLRKAQGGKTHEEGGRVTLDDLKDSSSIKQLSDIVIGLERDSQAEDVVKANTTNIRVLKNRDFGVKGLSETSLLYDRDTTRLQEVVRTDEDFD